MGFLTPEIERELFEALATTTSPRLVVGYDAETATAFAVWAETPVEGMPRMGAWTLSGPMPQDRVSTWAAGIERRLAEEFAHAGVLPTSVRIN